MLLEGNYEHTYWCSERRRGEDDELLAVLESDIEYLEKKAAFLEEFLADGGRIEYYVSWFPSERSGGTTIGHRLLARLAALRIDLSLDVYDLE